jgi:hypothetical protein
VSEPLIGDLGMTWDQLRTVIEDRQWIAKRLSGEMAGHHKRGNILEREQLRRRLTSMLQ